MGVAIVVGVAVVVLAFAGQWAIAIPLALVGAIVANRMGRKAA